MQITGQKLLVGLKEYFLMSVGMVFYSFGWIGCIMPAHGIGGGAAGLSLVTCKAIEQLFGIDIKLGTMVFIINGILLLVAGFIVGWKFGIKTIFSIAMLSLAMNFWQSIPEVQHLFDGMERILLVIMGGVLAGVGVAICFKQGGTTGGVDIVSLIINKYRTVRYGNIVMVADFTIIGSSMLVGMPLTTVIYGYIMTAVFGYTVDLLMSGNQQSSQMMIISPKYDAIADTITKELHRGVTLLDGMGWYTQESSKVLMVVCRKRESSTILKLVKSVDPNAFITVGSVMGVYGKGFGMLTKL
ncbi:MAG: YitT family protein [Alistipes sp.]